MSVTIIHNINGYTLVGNSLRTFGAMAFADSDIIAFDDDPESLFNRFSDARRIDGEGNTLLPGLTDAHAHLHDLGYSGIDVNLSGTESLEEAQDRLLDHYRSHPDLEWIRGRGWNQTKWAGGRFPEAEDLDNVIPDKPVWLERVDSHAGWANSEAIRRSGIDKLSAAPERGHILQNASGAPSGIFIDGAMELVRKMLPPRTEDEKIWALDNALELVASHGITTVHDAAVTPAMFQRFKRFADEERLTARIYAMLLLDHPGNDDLFRDGPVSGYGNQSLWLRSVKLFADGALGSRGAALIKPYNDEPGNSGILYYDQQTLDSMVKKGAGNGFQVNVHAIGDRANRQVLDAFQKLDGDSVSANLRHRIEHAQVVSSEDVPRFAELGLTASIQPVHFASDWKMAESRLGPDRVNDAYQWRSFLKYGVGLAGGSDFPIESSNPFWGLHAAITRKDRDGQPLQGWNEEERLSRQEAFRAFTLGAAHAGFMEQYIGSLEPGKKADFIVTDTDFFKVPEDEISEIMVIQTWMDGRCIYSSDTVQ